MCLLFCQFVGSVGMRTACVRKFLADNSGRQCQSNAKPEMTLLLQSITLKGGMKALGITMIEQKVLSCQSEHEKIKRRQPAGLDRRKVQQRGDRDIAFFANHGPFRGFPAASLR